MRKNYFKKAAGMILSGMLFASTLLISVPQNVQAEEQTNQESSWTVAIYMCGSDLESSAGCASCDLFEILDAEGVPEDVQIIIETGGSKKWNFKELAVEYYLEAGLSEDEIKQIVPEEEISSDYIQRYKVNYHHEYTTDDGTTKFCPALELLDGEVAVNNPDKADTEEDVVSMGDSDTLEDFLTYVRTQYPAEHSSLTLWNHGGGPANGVCLDSNAGNDMLQLIELQTALADAKKESDENSVVEKEFEVVGLQSFLNVTAEYAQKRSEELQNSLKLYDWDFTKKYNSYVTQAQSLMSSLFTDEDAAVLASYNGWEAGEHEAQAPMSVYFPLTGTGQYRYIEYTGLEYPSLGISSQYARLVYKIAAGIEKKQYEEIDTTLTWDAQNESYQYTLDEEQAPYVNAIGLQKYMKVKDEYYLVEKSESKDPAFYEVKPDNTYTTLNGVPCVSEVYWEVEGCTIYSMDCLVNGENVTLYYADDGQEVCLWYYDYDELIAGDEQISLQAGDTITPVVVASDRVTYYNFVGREERTKAVTEATYTVKAEDIRQDETGEIIVLPIKKETMKSENLNYAFFTFTNAINEEGGITSYTSVVNHQDILDFAGADISIEKAEFEVNGEPITPAVMVKGGSKQYEEGKDYELIYENNLGKGKASVTIAGLGQYAAVPNVTKEFSIVAASVKEVIKEVEKEVVRTEVVEKEVVKTVPQEVVKEVEKEATKVVTVPGEVKIVSAKKKNKNITIKYKKKNDSVQYQIAYSTKKAGKKNIVANTGKTSYTMKKANMKKVKYIYVRVYKTVDGQNYFGEWSAAKKVK